MLSGGLQLAMHNHLLPAREKLDRFQYVEQACPVEGRSNRSASVLKFIL
jgi:hypothetical protein